MNFQSPTESQPYAIINTRSMKALFKYCQNSRKRLNLIKSGQLKVQNERLVLLKASLENESQPEPCALLINQYIIIEIALKTFAKSQKLAKLNRKWTIKVQNEEKEV